MSTLFGARAALVPQRYRATLALLGAALLAMALLFNQEVSAAFGVWLSSTAYNHCFLVLPIALWLAWDRQHRLAELTPAPLPVAIVLALPFAAAWLLAERLGIMEGRQLAAMGMLQTLFLGVLGWRLYRAMAAPLLYLIFLIPFGGFLVPALQHVTTSFADLGLRLLDIPHFTHGYTIEIAQGAFHIAEACAGLRFLIAAIAFSVLYALLIFRSQRRRLLFVAIATIVPVIANGFRALGIVVLGHLLGSAQAAATDHVLYGYIFFSIVLFLLILLGLPFRQDQRREMVEMPAATPPPPPLARSAAPAVAIAGLAVAVVAVATAAAFAAAHAPAPLPAPPAGCTADGDPAALPAGGRLVRFACGEGIAALVAVFPPRTDPKPVFDAWHQFSLIDSREPWIGSLHVAGASPPNWQWVATQDNSRATASALYLDGSGADSSLTARLRLAWADLFGNPAPPMAVIVETTPPDREAAARLIATWR